MNAITNINNEQYILQHFLKIIIIIFRADFVSVLTERFIES